MDAFKTLRNNIYSIAYKYNAPNHNVHVRSLIQHVIHYLKSPQELEVLNDCLRVIEYIIYNIETDYAHPAYGIADTWNSVLILQDLSKNSISTAWASYLDKCCKYSYTSFRNDLAANIMARSIKTLKSGAAGTGLRNRRVIYDTDDLKYKNTPTVTTATSSTPTATSADMDYDYNGDEECDCDSFCGLCDIGFCEYSSDNDNDNDSNNDSSDDDTNILAISFSSTLPPTYEEDKDWMEVFYKYKKYNKLYQYMHDHIDSIAYDHEARLKYTTLLMSINRNVYNFASFLPEQSSYYRPLAF